MKLTCENSKTDILKSQRATQFTTRIHHEADFREYEDRHSQKSVSDNLKRQRTPQFTTRNHHEADLREYEDRHSQKSDTLKSQTLSKVSALFSLLHPFTIKLTCENTKTDILKSQTLSKVSALLKFLYT